MIKFIENLDDKFLKRRQEISKIYENVHMKKEGADSNGCVYIAGKNDEEISASYDILNGTQQGSVISPIW